MKVCQRCESQRLLEVSARSKDRTRYYAVNTPEDEDKLIHEGYSIGMFGGGGDEEEYTVCLECGQLQGMFPFDIEKFVDDNWGVSDTDDPQELEEIRSGLPNLKYLK